MKRFFVSSLLCGLCLCAMAAPALKYRVSGMAGTMLHGSEVDRYFGSRPVLGADIAVEFMPTGKWHCLQQWNNASVGLGVSYINLTNNQLLGNAVAPYAYLNIPFVSLPHFVFGIRPGFGVAFVDKTYYNTVPDGQLYVMSKATIDANWAIGSHTNAYFAEALYMEIPFSNGLSINASYGWYHISNGSIRQPNSGYNMFNGQIGLSYLPHADQYVAPQRERSRGLYSEGRRWGFTLSATGGVRQAYFADQKLDQQHYFGVATMGAAFHYRLWNIFQLGVGVDAFYDGYYKSVYHQKATAETTAPLTYFAKTYLADSNPANCWRVGLSLQPEFVIGRFSAAFHFGVYLYDPVRQLEPFADAAKADDGSLHRGLFYSYDIANAGVRQDGWLYTRIVTRFLVTRHLFVQLDMKSHLMKAEFISAGLGVKL